MISKERHLEETRVFLESRFSRIVAVLRAYFDESGTDENSKIIAVGGAVAEKAAWDVISEKWAAVLSQYNVSIFHSSDYNTRNNEFAGWDDNRRHAFIDELFTAMTLGDIRGIAYILNKDDYRELRKSYQRVSLTEYQFLSYTLSIQAGRLHSIFTDIEPIEIVFEAGQPFFTSAIGELLNDLGDSLVQHETGIKAITIQKKDGAIPLQIADLIVYELLKAHMRMIRKAPDEARYQARRLNEIMRGFAPLLTPSMIESYLAVLNR